MSEQKISIIVPVYNVEKYLPQCLDSLINQSLKEIQIICINDGSIDKSLNILKEYASRDQRILILDQKNAGVSIARNNGLSYATGEYYMFVDSDDWLDIDACEIVYKYAQDNQTDCLMFSYTKEFRGHSIINHIYNSEYFVWDKEDVEKNFHRRLFGPIDNELSEPQNADIIVSPCMQLFRTEKFKHIPFIDIREIGTFEDGLYQIFLYKDCEKFVYIDRPFYHYRKTNDESITTRYKADLYDKWHHLYDIIQSYIPAWNLDEVYIAALNNRIATGVVGLGINLTHSDNSIINGGKQLKTMLNTSRYREALSQLDISSMPIVWKVFFFMAKHRMTISLFAMLKIMEYLRNKPVGKYFVSKI